MARELNRLTVLNAIFSHFQMVTQWPNSHNSVRYTDKAESLVELLEVIDCGSVGGYDSMNPNKHQTGHALFDRFLTLLRKHNDEANIKPVCNAGIHTLSEYFSRFTAMRDDVYKRFPA